MTSLGLGWLSAANTCPSVRSRSCENKRTSPWSLGSQNAPECRQFPAPETPRPEGRERTEEIEATANAHRGDGSHHGPPESGLAAVVVVQLRKEERYKHTAQTGRQRASLRATWQSQPWKWWTSRGVHLRALGVVCCHERWWCERRSMPAACLGYWRPCWRNAALCCVVMLLGTRRQQRSWRGEWGWGCRSGVWEE
jgi:hypothetical protein